MAQSVSELLIVRYTPADLDALMEIENASFTAPWSRESYEELAPLESISIWVAKTGEKLAGYMLLQHVAGEMELHTIAVAEDLRRRGIGMRLMEHMLEESRRLGVNRIFLQVRPSNAAARRLYEKFGFRAVGIRRAYYRDNFEDALVMRLEMDK